MAALMAWDSAYKLTVGTEVQKAKKGDFGLKDLKSCKRQEHFMMLYNGTTSYVALIRKEVHSKTDMTFRLDLLTNLREQPPRKKRLQLDGEAWKERILLRL